MRSWIVFVMVGGCATGPTPVSPSTTTPAAAPAPVAPAPLVAELERLAPMVGRWAGTADVRRGPGEPLTVLSCEHVQVALGGSVLLIEGLGATMSASGEPVAVAHHALGIVSFDPHAKRHVMRAYRAGGQYVDADLELTDTGLVWEMSVGPRRIRNTQHIDAAGDWVEVSEMSADGVSWQPTIEMRLHKTGPAGSPAQEACARAEAIANRPGDLAHSNE